MRSFGFYSRSNRRVSLLYAAVVLALLFSLAPPPLPGFRTPVASAHNLDASAVYVYFDPDTQAILDARILGNDPCFPSYSPPAPLLRGPGLCEDGITPFAGDELGLIIKAVPDNGTTTGVGGYTDFYIPNGLQVLDTAYIMPGDLNVDGITGYDKVPMKGQAQMPAVGAGGGPTVSLVGISRGPNVLGVTSPIVTAANLNLGTLPGVYGDTGIFYSTAPETAYGSYTGAAQSIKNNSGDTVGLRTVLQKPLNLWDAWQMAGYGIAGTTNPAYPAAALVDSNQRGYAPWGLANVVAGPQSGYAWEFDFAKYTLCDPTPTTSPTSACIDTATQDIGPWQRIEYPGSQFADDPPGANPPVQPYTRGADASQSGFDLTTGDLPATTGQANGTPNAIRWAFGQLTYNTPEYAWLKVKVHNASAILDGTGCPVWHVDTFGGDAGGESGGKDHIWRYYDPNSLTFNGCLAIGKPATKELVRVGDYYQYKIKLYNMGDGDLANVVVQDTLPSGVTFVSASPAQNSGPNPLVWNVGALAQGDSFEAVVTVKASSTGVLNNSVTATGVKNGTPISASGSDKTVSGNTVLLRQSKSVSPAAVAPGGSVQYTITVLNIGSGPTGSPVKITEYLPTGFSYTGPLVSVTLNGANVTGTTTVGGTASQPVFTVPGTLNAGQSLVVVFDAQVSASAEPDSYCNSYTSNQNGINISTGALACVQVAGGKIGDTVWRDWDGDGVQDTGEEGIAGVTVKLYASNGTTLLATTTTDADGHYYFPGLTAGTYVVEVNNGAALAGTTQTGDPDGTFDNRHTVVLATDQQYLTADFGYEPTGAGVIGDKVFEDIGNDGSFDGADVGIPNVTVWLYEDSNDNGVIDAGDALVATTQSNATGDYSFTGLATGFDYLVKVDKTDPDVQAYFDGAYSLGTPSQLSTAELMPSPNLAGSDLDNDFGFWKVEPGSIGDMVFVDADGDGAYDAGETPLANVTVTLYRDSLPFQTTSTGPDGTYLFDNLGPGDYSVAVDTADPDLPAGLFATTSHYDKTLAAGENYLAADFPFVSGLTKTVDKSFADPAGSLSARTLTFTLKPYYPGTDLLENVRIIDPLPTGTTYIASSANAGGTYGAYTPLAAVPGNDPDGGPAGGVTLDTAISVSANFANTGGSVNVTLNVKQNSGATVNNVAPTDFEVAGGSAACTGPTPATANVPTGATGSNFVWACTLNSAGEFTFHAAAENDTATYTWPEAQSASVLSAPDGGSNVVTWSLGSNEPGIPGETLTSGYTAGVYAFRGDNTKEFSKYGVSAGSWTSKAQPTNGIEKGGSLTSDGAGVLYGLEGNSKIFYKYNIATNAWSTLANTSDNANEGGAVQYLNVSGTEYVFATLGGSNRFRRYSVSGNSWTAMANTPANVKKGGALTTDGAYLYAFRGDRKPDFWRYDVGANSWSTLTSAPANVGWGGALTRIGGYIYAFGGNNTANFWRYDIAGNTWSTLASAPGVINNGGGLTTDGTYVYALQGATKAFWRYDPAANTWTTLASANFTGNVGQGGALAYDPGLTPVGRFTSMTATPSLVSTGNQITVRLQLQSSTAVTNVIASSLTITPTGGASCGSTTGPTLVSADDDIADANDSVIYQWLCTVAAGSSPGSLTFSANGTGAGAVSFPTAQSRKVLVSPVLSFQASVNTSGAPAVIENTGLMVETSGAFGSLTSNTTETATAASLGDFVWADGDGDGVQDAGEPGLAGVKVYVDSNNNSVWDPGEPYDVTDANGDYRIYGLTPGSYTVRTDPATYPAGYLPTTASSLNVTLTSGLQYNSADFGLEPAGTGRIGDLVWLDADEDGVLDAGENGLPGITVTLEITVAGAWTPVATTTTDASGLYTFTGLIAGDYRVTVDPTSQVTSPYAAGAFDLGAAMDPTYDLDDGTVSPDGVTLVTLPTDSTVVSNADFGYNWGGSIGDYVWEDTNANGLQDESPATPIQGAFVMLYYDANDNGELDPGEYGLVAFDFTDVNGAYLFDNLPPGNYLVDVYEDSITDDGNRNIVPTTADVQVVTLGPNDDVQTADFGYYEGAWVRGSVFHDADSNAIFDAAENGLTPVTVYLCAAGTDPCNAGSALATTTTDADGDFVFLVPEGDYVVTYDSGDTSAYPDATTPTSYTFHAQPGEDWQQTFEFGVDHSGALGDRVWNDADADGVQDAGEPGLAGVTVSLYQDNDNNGILSAGDTFLAAQVTDAVGNYLFDGLPDGNYITVVNPSTVPTDFDQTYDNFGSLDHTSRGAVSGGATVLTADFGYRYDPPGGASLYTLSGRVYDDQNDNGNDDGEPGFAGVDVTLVCDFGTVVATTNGTGAWTVAGIPAGSVCTLLDAAETDLPRSDYTAAETPGVPITVNSSLTGLDFGYHQTPGSISGVVCVGGGDGQCSASEPGLAGVLVTLTWGDGDGILGTPDDVVVATTTSITGFYTFTNLEPGPYQVVETNPAGYTSVADRDGANPDNIAVTLGLGQDVVGRDFEDEPITGSVAGVVFADLDGDGVQDPGELPLSGVTVDLLGPGPDGILGTPDDVVVATTTTTGSGAYNFANIPVGPYLVRETDPAGYTSTTPNTVPISVAGGAVSTVDFGDQPTATVSGVVFDDNNGSGLQDPGEPGISGVTVQLIDPSTGAVIATTTTNASGGYTFTGVTPGSYIVRETDPAGYTSTTPNNVPISVVAGGSANANFGDQQVATVVGTVFEDIDGSGLQDPGEPGISGVTVGLYDSGGSLVGTTLTNANGDYIFSSVTPGAYTVRETDPAGYTSTTPNTVAVSVPPNGVGVADFGDQQQGTISGVVFDDPNGNGLQDPGESGLGGVLVQLVDPTTGAVIASTLTNPDGSYTFTGVTPGPYIVRETDPAGYTSTTGNDVPVSVASGGSATANFGDQLQGAVSGVVFDDIDGNGLQDPGEGGLGGVTVGLYDSGGTLVATTTTAGDGSYLFTGVTPGAYTVRETDPAGYNSTTSNTVPVSVPAGGSATANFGDRLDGVVSGLVYNDADGDGLQDPGEGGLGGVTVQLLDPTTGAVIATTTTAGDGSYLFTGVTPGAYIVREVDPAGFTSTTPNSVPVSVPAGGSASANFGDQQVGTVVGTVFDDANGNGLQDPGENGLGGVTVGLYDSGGTLVATTTTAGNGSYLFSSVTPGAYTVRETDPAGYSSTTSNIVPVSVPPGGSASADFGDRLDGVVSGVVFGDTNANGVQDPGEGGLGGVTVQLIDSTTGLVVATTTTAGDGSYLFTGVTPGPYIVRETDPAGYASTTPNDVAVSVPAGGSASANFGDNLQGTVAGVVFDDLNGNGVQEPGEAGLGGVTVGLYTSGGTLVSTTTTAGDGSYIFTNVTPGNYSVRETDPTGWTSTTPNQVPVTVPPGGLGHANFGDQLIGTVTGVVFDDLNGNGVQDPGEDGLAGVTVQLVDPGTGGVIATTTTAGDGSYIFRNVAPGAYTVRETDPTGWSSTTPNDVSVNVPAGGAAVANFGDRLVGTVSGVVFDDVNSNGTQQFSENGLAGVTVGLYDNSNTLVASTVTASDGSYLFTNVPPGSYTVRETDPPGFLSTTPNDVPVSVPAGGSASANFGDQIVAFGAASLSGMAFLDTNGNGAHDPGETVGISGAPVTIYGPNGLIITRTTTITGFYSVSNLTPGVYTVTMPSVLNAPTAARTTPGQLTATLSAGQHQGNLDFGYVLPTGFSIVAFTAQWQTNVVLVRWVVLNEGGLAGYHIYRSTDPNGSDLLRITQQIVPIGNGAYQVNDATALQGQPYWYWLQTQPDGLLFGPTELTRSSKIFVPVMRKNR